MSKDIDDMCRKLKIKYVMVEFKEKRKYEDNPRQKIAIALHVADKFCADPKSNIDRKFLESFSEKTLRRYVPSKAFVDIGKDSMNVKKKDIIDWILNNLSNHKSSKKKSTRHKSTKHKSTKHRSTKHRSTKKSIIVE